LCRGLCHNYLLNPHPKDAFRIHANVRIVREHLRGNVPRNRHNRLVAGLRFGKLRDGVVPQVVESKSRGRAFDAANIGLVLLVLARFAGIL